MLGDGRDGCGTVAGLGLGLGLVSEGPILRRVAWGVTQVFRNVPWLVLLFFVMFLVPFQVTVFGLRVPLPDWVKATVGFALPVMANVAEIVRGAVRSVPATQWEATVPIRVIATAREREQLRGFPAAVGSLYLQGFPGFHHDGHAQAAREPWPRIDYWPALVPAEVLVHRAVLDDGTVLDAPTPSRSATDAEIAQPRHPEPAAAAPSEGRRVPLGEVESSVHTPGFGALQGGVVHPAAVREHGCGLAGPEQLLAGGGQTGAGGTPQRVQFAERRGQPVGVPQQVDVVGQHAVLHLGDDGAGGDVSIGERPDPDVTDVLEAR